MARDGAGLEDLDYQRLLRLRIGLRRFLHSSEERARAAGLTPSQHQLLLAIRGWPGAAPPTVGELADALLIRPHSAVGLIDRASHAGLVERRSDAGDHRVVRVVLSPAGAQVLEELSTQHLTELTRLAGEFGPLVDGRRGVGKPGATGEPSA